MIQKLDLKKKIFLLPTISVVIFLFIFISTEYLHRKSAKEINMLSSKNLKEKAMYTSLSKELDHVNLQILNKTIIRSKDISDVVNNSRNYILNIMRSGKDKMKEMNSDKILNDFREFYSLAEVVANDVKRGYRQNKLYSDLQVMTAKYKDINSNLLAAIDKIDLRVENSIKKINGTENALSLIIALILFGGLAVSIIVAVKVVKAIAEPLNIAISCAEQVAEGHLNIDIPEIESNDELSSLLKSFKRMIISLKELAIQIKEASNSLAASAGQISTSVTQIASAAAETASAATQTNTTVEEVRQTAIDSNRKAKHVSESAQKAVKISQAGEKTVAETIEEINRIEKQMESIADSIMRLSEHGQAISSIITTVEDVAEQSRLLAVNASIEAVKAGEQGKGFAVVAQEVRSLAEQSKQATNRIRNILDEIQKATSEAVMKTEQGSKAVKSGVEQSLKSGETIQRLANSVAEAAQATTQIAVSSQEQTVGMDQVVSAMESIKQASNQNVAATKQVETAAQDLYKLGQTLTEIVKLYKI